MPATAGRVRMPANNRMSTSATLRTHDMWSHVIGYDPYAPKAADDAAGGAAGGGGAGADLLERAQKAKMADASVRKELAVDGVQSTGNRLTLEAAVAMGWRPKDARHDVVTEAPKHLKGLAAFAAEARGVHLDDDLPAHRAASPGASSTSSSSSTSDHSDSSEERAREERRRRRKRERKEKKEKKKKERKEKKRRLEADGKDTKRGEEAKAEAATKD